MPSINQITITFTEPINISAQTGDKAYYTGQTSLGGFSHDTGLVTMGSIISIAVDRLSLVCDISSTTPRPTSSSFICFAKDTRVNLSGLTGYFAEVEFRTTAQLSQSELFMVSSEISESSK